MANGKKSIVRQTIDVVRDRIKRVSKYVGYKWILPTVYLWYARRPIEEDLVVFADHREREMPDNFVGLYEMCLKSGYHCEFLSGKSFSSSNPKWMRKKLHMQYRFRFMKLYAQSRVVFLVDYFDLADIVKKRPETQVVQLWHACGLLKRWGYAVTSSGWGATEKELKRYPIYVNQTLSVVSSHSMTVKNGYRAAFRCDPEIIKPLGVPRTDSYFNEACVKNARDKIKAVFPEIGDRKIILYAPTFRGKSIPKSYIDHGLDFRTLKNELSKEYAVITKFHPLMVKPGLPESGRIMGLGFVFDATHVLTAEEVLPAADILVTDYSSIQFEYLLFERPIISYIYDIDKYVKDRDLFLPYERLAPGPYVFTQAELVEKVKTVDKWFDIEKTQRYKEEFMSACDGRSTERIFQYVFGQEAGK